MTYKERVIQELVELTDKADRLRLFIDSEAINKLPHEDKSLLIDQWYVMDEYRSILGKRISRFS